MSCLFVPKVFSGVASPYMNPPTASDRLAVNGSASQIWSEQVCSGFYVGFDWFFFTHLLQAHIWLGMVVFQYLLCFCCVLVYSASFVVAFSLLRSSINN